MRFVFNFLIFTAFCLASLPSYADDFGERFYNQTPRGMADHTIEDSIPSIAMDDMAADLQNIIPAAGDDDGNNTSERSSKVKEGYSED